MMVAYQREVNTNITFDDNKILGQENIDEQYNSKREILLEYIYFKQDLAILTTKKVFRFKNCIINGNLFLPDNVSKIYFEKCTIASVKGNIQVKGGTIKKLDIKNATIKEKFYLNNNEADNEILTIEELDIEKVIFEKNFKLINCNINKFKICHCDFQQDMHISGESSCLNSEDIILFHGINFKGNSYFSETEFQTKVEFSKVTFLENVDFQKTKFFKGLDLNKTTIKRGINFAGCSGLNTKQSIENTPKETYRIIKNNFLKLQNRIEANKFYSLELKKQKQLLWNLPCCKNIQDKIVYLLHMLSSNYGRSWIVALIGIWLIGLLTSLYINSNMLSGISNCPKDIIEYILLEGVKYSYLLNRSSDFFNSHPVIYVLNKIVLGYWYYQFVMAVRKDTKR